MTPSTPDETSMAPKRAGLVLGALIAVAAVANLGLAVANVALPRSGSTRCFADRANLIAVGYSLGLAASVLYFGAVGDRYGRKLLLILGMILTVPADCLAAWAPSIDVLFAARVIGGLAAGSYPTTLALITALWSGSARTKSIALWARSAAGSWLSARSARGSSSSTTGGGRSSCSPAARRDRARARVGWCRVTSTNRPSRSTISAVCSRSRSLVPLSSGSTSRLCRTKPR